MPFFSIVIPVYNRPGELRDLLLSLSLQTSRDFEVLVVEDGSSLTCDQVVEAFKEKIPLRYFFKPNTGQSDSRNYGMRRAAGRYFVLLDSDCILPRDYFESLYTALSSHPLDCFGGADAALPDFSIFQKAVNYSMTSFLTTGGIRGSKRSLESFKPRSFNMGFSRTVFEKTGGFSDLHVGEDIDLSLRIGAAGFSIGFIPEAFVYHRRKLGYSSFFRQVFRFGQARVVLSRLHKGSLKVVHTLPAFFILGVLLILGLMGFSSVLWGIPFAGYFLLLFTDALFKTCSIRVAACVLPVSFIQLAGYGLGFWKSVFTRSGSTPDPRKNMYKI